jgi:hypothetical protein
VSRLDVDPEDDLSPNLDWDEAARLVLALCKRAVPLPLAVVTLAYSAAMKGVDPVYSFGFGIAVLLIYTALFVVQLKYRK